MVPFPLFGIRFFALFRAFCAEFEARKNGSKIDTIHKVQNCVEINIADFHTALNIYSPDTNKVNFGCKFRDFFRLFII